MTTPMSHEELREMLAAYALDAVPADEAEELRVHLLECPSCRDQLEQLRDTAAFLSYGGGEAPPELWSRIEASLDEAPPPLRLHAVDQNGQAVQGGKPRERRTWRSPLAAIAAAVVLVVAGVAGGVLIADRQDEGPQTVAEAAGDAAEQPGAEVTTLRASDGDAVAEVVVLPDGTGFISSTSLPALPEGETYQLWALGGPAPVSLGVLGREAAPATFTLGTPAAALAISREDGNGAASPTLPPVGAGEI